MSASWTCSSRGIGATAARHRVADRRALDPIEAMDLVERRLFVSVAGVAGAEAVLEPDLAMGSLGVPIPPLNVISGARLDGKDVDARIDRALVWFADRGMPVSWWIGPHDRPRDLGEYLARDGLVRIEAGIPGMAADLNRLPDETPPPDLVVERVHSPQAFREACEVIAAGFGAPMEVAEAMARFAETAIGDDVAQRVFLVRADGRAVGTALGVA